MSVNPGQSKSKFVIDVSDLLIEAEEIERRHSEWLTLVRDEQVMADKRKRDVDSRAGIAELEVLMMKLETELKGEIVALQAQLSEKRLSIERFRYAITEHEYDNREYHRLLQKKHGHQELVEQGIRERIRIEMLEKQIADLEVEMEALKESAVCRTCGRPLDETESAAFIEKETGRLEQLKDQLRTSNDRITLLRENYVESEAEMKHLDELGKRLVIAETKISELRELESESEKLRDQIEKMQARLRSRAFGRKEQKAIATLENDIRINGYDAEKHREIQERLQLLTVWKHKKELLDWVRTRKEP